MPDVPIRPKPEPEPTLAEKMAPAADAVRTLLTGDARGRVRRPLLFAAVGAGIVLQLAAPVLGAVIAIPALLLLAFTDQVV